MADGASVLTETIFENRYMHVPELARMGADIQVQRPHRGRARGRRLAGAPVMATDLRASMSLILAGLAAEGETEVSRVYHLDRGYERLEEKLSARSARISSGSATGEPSRPDLTADDRSAIRAGTCRARSARLAIVGMPTGRRPASHGKTNQSLVTAPVDRAGAVLDPLGRDDIVDQRREADRSLRPRRRRRARRAACADRPARIVDVVEEQQPLAGRGCARPA